MELETILKEKKQVENEQKLNKRELLKKYDYENTIV